MLSGLVNAIFLFALFSITALFSFTLIFLPTQTAVAETPAITNEARCASYAEHKDTCADRTKSSIKVSVSFDNGTTAQVSCAAIKQFIVSTCPDISLGGSSSKSLTDCRASYTNYRTSAEKKSEKCAKFGDCKSQQFETCIEALNERDMEEADEKSFEKDEEEFLKACPFYAKEEVKQTEERKKELEEQISTKEEKLKKLVDDMKQKADDSAKSHGEMQEDIARLEKEQQEALIKMHEQVGNITSASTQTVNKIRQTIEELQYNTKQKNISELGKANIAYSEVMNEIQKQCYEIGRQAAAAESVKLGNRKGISSRYLMSVAKKNIIEHLRAVANEAYRQCQNKRAFKGAADTAAHAYAAQYKSLELENKRTNERIAALQKEFLALPQKTQEELTNVQGQGYNEVMGISNQVQAKRQQLQQLQANSTQLAMRNSQEMSQLQAEQFNDEKSFRAMKANLGKIRGLSRARVPSQEEFDTARSALEIFNESKRTAQNACCEEKGGQFEAINGQADLCAGMKANTSGAGSSGSGAGGQRE